MPAFGRINLRDKAYDSFTRHLLSRSIRPGQFVSQRQLVELTGLSLAAIRELVPRLETEGLISTAPQRGLQIASIDVNLIRDAFQFRLFIEREAVAEFAKTAPAAVVAVLRQEHVAIIDAVEGCGNGAIPEALVRKAQAVDLRLHRTIIETLGNKLIADAYRVNAIKLSLVRQEQGLLFDKLVLPAMRDHMRIIEAIEAGDGIAAADAMAAHIMIGRNRALGVG